MRHRGTVKWFNATKGFGFIQREGSLSDVFVHWTEIDGHGYKTLDEGDSVEFNVGESSKGPAASKVVIVSCHVIISLHVRGGLSGSRPASETMRLL